ncbi:MAG TPA: Uma2 family endonuclease [Bryobacteraceae bacterium]|jgi:Uma2 family endonuclease|nr:Uma2 family endonuclease [Bryobacteraceae bacterium]
MLSVEEYLSTVYRPDCDYVDGEVLERNFGERPHSYVQAAIGSYFFTRRKAWGIEVYPEQRVQVKPRRYRIPDVCVVLGGTKEKIFTKPPFLCAEILSPEDRMTRVWDRIHDFFEMGVPNVWIIDPETRIAHIASPTGDLHRVTNILRTTDPVLEVPLSEIFE